MSLSPLLASIRIRQWTKNILIFAALIFSNHALQKTYLLNSLAAFFLFSFAAGAIYILNDIVDAEKDREHPVKKNRPIASGKLGVWTAAYLGFVLAVLSISISFFLNTNFGIAVLIYILLQIFYTLYFKKIVILDVLAVSASYLLRVIAGALVINVVISDWILVCTMLLAMFLSLSKRRHELTLLEGNATGHRLILKEYSPYLLDQMIGVVTSATLVAYMIYCLSDETTLKFGRMILTVPFVLYGILRYLYLVHKKNAGGQPEEVLLSDIPLQIAILAYGITALLVIYF
jgi:4-hydroxybenzoate polyprenyltransferase